MKNLSPISKALSSNFFKFVYVIAVSICALMLFLPSLLKKRLLRDIFSSGNSPINLDGEENNQLPCIYLELACKIHTLFLL